MLTRQELENLIKAWPDENGVSSDPETYNAWLERDYRPYAHIFDGRKVELNEAGTGSSRTCF